jgi:hypothetical protein
MQRSHVVLSRPFAPVVSEVFSKDAGLKPHESLPWLNQDRLADLQQFAPDVQAICALYHYGQELHEHRRHVGSTDEKTSIQANERAHPTRHMSLGPVERVGR